MKTQWQLAGKLVGGALLGLLFVIFLPLIGFVMLLYHLMEAVRQGFRRVGHAVADVMVPGFALGHAGLTKIGAGRKRPQAAAPEQERPLATEEQSVRARREQGEA